MEKLLNCTFRTMPYIANVDIEIIREIVPDLLFSRLKRYHITSMERVLNISVEEFMKYPSVGVIGEQQLPRLITKMITS